jgi:predicted Zn-dependent peptidase
MLWPDHPLGQSITGSPETLAGITPDHLRAHRAAFFYPANCVLAVAGNVRAGTVMEAVRRHFGAWSGPAAPYRPRPANGAGPAGAGPLVKTVADSDNQFHVQLSFPAPGYNAPEEVPLLVMTRLLDDGPSSLLQRVVREERALVYGISGGYNGFQDAGQFDIATSVKAERLVELLDCLRDVLRRLCADGPTLEDLDAARRRHRYDLAFGRDSLSAWVDRYAWPHLYSTVRGETEELERFAAVTADEIRGLAARLFTRDRLHVAVVGPMEEGTEAALRRVMDGW